MVRIDYDKSGTIEFQEFVLLMKKVTSVHFACTIKFAEKCIALPINEARLTRFVGQVVKTEISESLAFCCRRICCRQTSSLSMKAV